MAKAQKLPSGNYRCRASYVDATGKTVRKSFTAKTAKQAERLAERFLEQREYNANPANKTLREAATEYVEARTSVLSPSTINGYKKIIKGCMPGLFDTRLSNITKQSFQKAINEYAKDRTPRTVLNVFTFTNSVLKDNNIKISDTIVLPKKKKTEIAIPSKEEMVKILKHFSGTRLELTVKFAVFLGLRKSEIYGIQWKDIDDNKHTVTISKARVNNDSNGYTLKQSTKTIQSSRTLVMPDALFDSLPERGDDDSFVIDGSPAALNSMYKREMKKIDMPYTFHALRHYYASVMLQQGVPNKYAKERMGHSTENMLQNVYQHTFKDTHEEINEVMNNYFDGLMEDDYRKV